MKIQILMSAYNGEKYIEEQIQSLINNKKDDMQLSLLVRDDGSSDNTVSIVKKMQKQNLIDIDLLEESNIGVTKSFLKLIKMAPSADLYFFCDQDDVWLADKISMAQKAMRDTSVPELYIADYYLTDGELNIIEECAFPKEKKHTLLQILFANVSPGCAMAFNKALLREMRRVLPEDVPMHDLYALAVAYCSGKVYHIHAPLLYYRQHGNNTEGVQSKKINLKRIWKKQKSMMKKSENHTAELARLLYAEYRTFISEKEQKNLRLIAEYKNSISRKIRLLRNNEIYYSGIRAKVLTFEKIMLGKY